MRLRALWSVIRPPLLRLGCRYMEVVRFCKVSCIRTCICVFQNVSLSWYVKFSYHTMESCGKFQCPPLTATPKEIPGNCSGSRTALCDLAAAAVAKADGDGGRGRQRRPLHGAVLLGLMWNEQFWTIVDLIPIYPKP